MEFAIFGGRCTVLGYLETLLRYLVAAAVTISEADVCRALVEVLPTLEERIMPTMVETWLEQGIQTGEKRMLLRLLERRFGKVL